MPEEAPPAAVAASAEDGSIDLALEAALPEDAPPGHEAFAKVRFNGAHRWPLAEFKYGSGAEAIRFQTTMGACGSREATERVARACYVRFCLGQTVEQVKQFRQEVYDRVREVRQGPRPEPTTKKPRSRGSKKEPDGEAAARAVPAPAAEAVPADAAVRAPVGAKTNGSTAPKVKAEPPAMPEPEGPPSFIHEDAPPESAAHRRNAIGYDRSSNSFNFRMPGENGNRKRFSISITRSGNSVADALCITRLCFAKFEAGMSEDEVKRYRGELLARCGPSPPAKDGLDGKREHGEDARDSKSRRRREATEGSKEENGAKRPKTEPQSDDELRPMAIQEDAPEGSAAHQRVKFHKNKQAFVFEFLREDGTRERFQTTVRACNGSSEDAKRAARLCYAHFESGASRESVEEFRNQLYARCTGGVPPQQKQRDKAAEGRSRKRRRVSGVATLIEQLRKEGRLEGALVVEGRDAAKKNASVNGLYAPVQGGFGGVRAYEKVGSADAPRFIYFFAGRSRWKISETLGDEKGGFAFLKVKDGGGGAGPHEQGPDQKWHVFDGKSEGYNEDQAVRCYTLEVGAGDGSSRAAKVRKDAANGGRGDDSTASSASSADSDSEEASSASSGSQSSSGSEDDGDAVGRTAVAAAAPRADPAAEPSLPKHAVSVPRRVCAKMLVRSGLRCGCHFSYTRDCPALRAGTSG